LAKSGGGGGGSAGATQEEIEANQRMIEEMNKSWEEKLREANAKA